jgi:uncharacterized membrane protein
MGLRHFITLLLLVLFLVSQVAAQELYYDITIVLSESDAHETVQIGYNNTMDVPFEGISYELPGDAKNIKVRDAQGGLMAEISYGAETTIRSNFRNPIQPGDYETITMEFDTEELVSFSGGEYIFSAIFSPPVDHTNRFLLKIELPKGMGLVHPISSAAQTDIAPLPDKTVSDGTRTIFEWDVRPQGEFAVFVRYKAFSTRFDINKFILLAFAVLALLLVVYYLSRKRPRKKEPTGFMKEDEKVIIGLVKENEGVVQKRLVEHTGFSKAKISKIVSDLKKRKILRVEKIGRRNKLFLTEEFKKR